MFLALQTSPFTEPITFGTPFYEVFIPIGIFAIVIMLIAWVLSRISPRKNSWQSLISGEYEARISILEKRVLKLEQELEQAMRDDRNRTPIKRLGSDTGERPKPTK